MVRASEKNTKTIDFRGCYGGGQGGGGSELQLPIPLTLNSLPFPQWLPLFLWELRSAGFCEGRKPKKKKNPWSKDRNQ